MVVNVETVLLFGSSDSMYICLCLSVFSCTMLIVDTDTGYLFFVSIIFFFRLSLLGNFLSPVIFIYSTRNTSRRPNRFGVWVRLYIAYERMDDDKCFETLNGPD